MFFMLLKHKLLETNRKSVEVPEVFRDIIAKLLTDYTFGGILTAYGGVYI